MSGALAAKKRQLKSYLDAFAHPDPAAFEAAVAENFVSDAAINIVHPFNEVAGAGAYMTRFLHPLMAAFAGLHRRDYIITAGTFEGADWVTCTGHWCGTFTGDWLGIPATGRLTYLRVGEFHRVEAGKFAESYIFLDLPELMMIAGVWPITDSPGEKRGFTGFLPGPATQDGLRVEVGNPVRSAESAALVTDMLRALATEDETWRPYWHPNMAWYGPAAFGAFLGIEDFASFQVPFESVFEGWSGGAANNGMTKHLTRAADGDYIWTAGWPSLTGVQVKPFLDQPATGKRVFMRVCDWWRREGDLLVENWVFVDIPDVLKALGRDVFEGIEI